MDHTTTAQEKRRTDAPHDQADSSQQAELVCDHTLELFDEQGQIRGSWAGEDSSNGIRYSCRHCGKFYGYQPNKQSQVGCSKPILSSSGD